MLNISRAAPFTGARCAHTPSDNGNAHQRVSFRSLLIATDRRNCGHFLSAHIVWRTLTLAAEPIEGTDGIMIISPVYEHQELWTLGVSAAFWTIAAVWYFAAVTQ